jgi:porin
VLSFFQIPIGGAGRLLVRARALISCLGLMIISASSALAQTPTPAGASGTEAFGSLTSLSTSSTLLGDMGGLRPSLTKYGVALTIEEQSEVLGNLSGGRRQGFEYDGQTTATLQVDTKAVFGLAGGLFNVSALQLHGRNLSVDNLLALQGASGVEGDRATRLWELWYQQKMFDDKFDVKIGQQSLDQEFKVSQESNLFINNSSGWPELPAADMPGGGPGWPLSVLGVRALLHASDSATILAGIFNGSPVANNTGDPQKQNPSGISFPLNGGALAIAELRWASPASAAVDRDSAAQALTYTYKIGAWYDSERFADLRFDTTGGPLASPASNGVAATHRGDYAFYAVADQMIYRWQNDPDRSISVFLRPMFTPLQDRNLVSFSLNAGATMHQPLAGRKDDTFGVSLDYARISSGATGFSLDSATLDPGVFTPPRRSETVIEATYLYQLTPWWQFQPDIQYFFNPGGGISNPDNPAQRVKNETVLGLRTDITF